MAFMFERSVLPLPLLLDRVVVTVDFCYSCLMVGVSDWGLKKCQKVQPDYVAHSWEPLEVVFKRPEQVNGKH